MVVKSLHLGLSSPSASGQTAHKPSYFSIILEFCPNSFRWTFNPSKSTMGYGNRSFSGFSLFWSAHWRWITDSSPVCNQIWNSIWGYLILCCSWHDLCIFVTVPWRRVFTESQTALSPRKQVPQLGEATWAISTEPQQISYSRGQWVQGKRWSWNGGASMRPWTFSS